MLPAVVASLPFNIRVIHLHGGEVSLGAVDNRIRHAVSLMSSLHFVAHENAKIFLRENKAVAYDIEDKIRAAHGLDFVKPSDEGPPIISDDDNVIDL